MRPRPQRTPTSAPPLPTPPTATPNVDKPTITPIGAVSPTPDIGLEATPTTVILFPPTQPGLGFVFPTPDNSIVLTPLPGGQFGGGPSVPVCPARTGDPNALVRAYIPPGIAGGAGVFCKTITDQNQIGDAAVIGRGVLLAVDIFAMTGSTSITRFNSTMQVCLQGRGNIFFRDATQSPRSTAQMQTTFDGGFTCTDIPNAGTVILTSR